MFVRTITQVWQLLRNKRVNFSTKLIYVLTMAVYTLSPDFLPFLPFDDIFVIWLASRIFVGVASREAGLRGSNNRFKKDKDKDKDVIDTKGDFVE